MQFYRTAIGGLKFSVTLPEVQCGVGHIFHDMRCKPYGFYAQLFIQAQYFQCFFHRLHTVVHTRQNVRVTVGKILEYTAIFQRYTFPEWPHNDTSIFI